MKARGFWNNNRLKSAKRGESNYLKIRILAKARLLTRDEWVIARLRSHSTSQNEVDTETLLQLNGGRVPARPFS
jgi:hypothetical protein